MTECKYTTAILLTVVFSLALTSTASAQSSRSYVSVEGSDTNSCSERYPCRTFARALSVVAAKGEVIAVAPNQRTGPDGDGGFAPFTITKSVSIIGFPGAYTGITATSGNAITINAGAADTVVIRGLTLNGVGGASGITANTVGSLWVENCVINGFPSYGIFLGSAGRLFINDTSVRNAGAGAGTGGIWVNPQSGSATVSINRCRVENINNIGVFASGSKVTVRDTVLAGSGFGVNIDTNGVQMDIENCQITGNVYGIYLPGGSTARVSNSTITGNQTGVFWVEGGVLSRGNNTLEGNDDNGSFSGSFSAK